MTLVLGNVNSTAEAQNLTLTVRGAERRPSHGPGRRGGPETGDPDRRKSRHRHRLGRKRRAHHRRALSREQGDLMHQMKDAMGYAPASGTEGGRLAYVLNYRVDEVSAGYRSAEDHRPGRGTGARDGAPAPAIKAAQLIRPDAQEMGAIRFSGCQSGRTALHAGTGPGDARRIGEWAMKRAPIFGALFVWDLPGILRRRTSGRTAIAACPFASR